MIGPTIRFLIKRARYKRDLLNGGNLYGVMQNPRGQTFLSYPKIICKRVS